VEHENEKDAIAFVLALGRALHRYGTPSHRLEEALAESCERLGLRAELFTTPTTIIMTFGEPTDLRTAMMRVGGGELDMDKLEQVDDLADDVANGEVTPLEGVARLAKIDATPTRFSRPLTIACHGITAGAMAVFFGGLLADVAVAGAIGLLLGLLAQFAQRSTDQARVFELVGAACAAFAASVASSLWDAITPSLVTMASLIVLLPGMALTIAMIELATRNLMAGTARLMSAVIVLLELVVGVALGERLAATLVTIHQPVPHALPEWANWIALAAAASSISVVVRAQTRAFAYIVLACTVGYVGTRAGTEWLGQDMATLGVLVGAIALGVLGNVFARLRQRPAQVVLIPAVLLLVPGSMGFRGMTSLLDRDTLTGVETVFGMFVVALALGAGLLVANAIISPRRSL